MTKEEHDLPPWPGLWPTDPEILKVLGFLREVAQLIRPPVRHYLVAHQMDAEVYAEVVLLTVGRVRMVKCSSFGNDGAGPARRAPAAFGFSDPIFLTHVRDWIERNLPHVTLWECDEGGSTFYQTHA